MRRLCLSAALLVLLVILVDSTPLNIHHTQDEGLETSHRQGREKHSTKDLIKNIIDGVSKGAKIVKAGSGLANEVAKAIHKRKKGHVVVSRAHLKNHTVRGVPNTQYSTLNTQHLILNEKNKADSRPDFCLKPKVVGIGKASMRRYFYNAKTGHCEPFTYGGIRGNKNNFLTLGDCRKTCHPKAQSLW
ncbi:trophoblast Kunitz domain protein 1-like [Cervus elaphus]|uniref:trophoblast Kunitz domain protein 1-like n=1 Tax=Cervus elaphus TaxID=9860 RepID=UPI001CC31595|nr:trophoblast Kunitz domain protein 1-like [Cervus elaphus]